MPYIIDGSTRGDLGEPILQSDILWVPLRKVGQALGTNVDYEPSTGVAIVYKGESIITVTPGDKAVEIDGEQVELQGAPLVQNGETWVPVRFFEKLGYHLTADWENKIVDLSSSA